MATQNELNEKMTKVAEAQLNLAARLVDRLQSTTNPPAPRPLWASLADFMQAVRNQAAHHLVDHRLQNVVTTYAGGDTAGSTGYALPEQYSGVVASVAAPDALLARFGPVPLASDLLTAAVDSNPDWAAQLDATPRKAGEAVTASKPSLQKVTVPATKVGALVHVSDELVERAGPGYFAYLAGILGRRVRNEAERLLMRGTGMDEPLGALNTPSLVVVSKETSQTAATINTANVSKMAARLAPYGFERAFWAIHSSTLPQIMTLGVIYQGSQPGAPYGTILGRPVVVTEHAGQLGERGDVTLIDPSGYLVGIVGPDLKSTIEFAFDQGLDSYRATLHLAAVPLLGAAVARKAGSDTLSHTVTLEARS